MTETTDQAPILVAIDFSEDSKAALLWACKFAECNDAPLVLLHVVHDLASHPGFYQSKDSKQLEPMQDVAEEMMNVFLAEVRAEHPVLPALDAAETQLIPGLPPRRIIDVSGLLNCCLIVMGGRGMTGHGHKMLGSVAERVAELSMTPVVLVKSEMHGILGKKALKKKEKQRKKDRRKLKDLLGLGTKTNE